MPEEPEDRPSGDEEEFEDLDKFFAPIEDVDWPEEGGTEAPAEGGPLPQEPAAPAPAAPDPEQPFVGEGTQEMSGPEWEELRLDVDEGDQGSVSPPPAESGLPYPEAEEERELSLEDLKNPPPEYADLPGPPDEEPDVPAAEEPTATFEGDPARGDVEAAADRMAASLRDEEDEPVPVPTSDVLLSPDEVEEDLLSDLQKGSTPPPTITVGGTETLGGPSWQEPTSEEVSTSRQVAPPGGRNLPLAFLSGIVLAAIGIGAIAIGKAPFTVVVGAVILLGQGELYAALHRKGHQPATALGLVFGGLIVAAGYLRGEAGAVAMFGLSTVFTFLWFMAVPAKSRHNTVSNIATTLFGLAYVPLLGSFVGVILALPFGRSLVLTVLGLTLGYDIVAYAVGSLWGDKPLAPTISPRKSREGAIAATLVVLVVCVAAVAPLDAFGDPGWPNALWLGLVISLFAPLGDLAESLIKRDLGLKDMGSILPGHGGALDRIDSLLFAAPAAFYFFRLVLF